MMNNDMASMSQIRRIKFQLQEKTDDDLKKIRETKPYLKEVIDKILEERKTK